MNLWGSRCLIECYYSMDLQGSSCLIECYYSMNLWGSRCLFECYFSMDLRCLIGFELMNLSSLRSFQTAQCLPVNKQIINALWDSLISKPIIPGTTPTRNT